MPERDSVGTEAERPVPGDRNFATDMEVSTLLVTAGRCLMHAPLTDRVRSPWGCASVGMLMTLVDVGASSPALIACRPDWTVTQDLGIHGAGWLTDGPIVVDNQLVRVGKKVIVVAADIYDGQGLDDFDQLQAAIDKAKVSEVGGGPVLAAKSLLTFVRIPRTATRGVDDYDPSGWIGQIQHRATRTPAAGTMYERMGLKLFDAPSGVLELAHTPYVANSIGTINGGAQAVLIEAAAEAMRPGLVAIDMQLHFLSQLRAGPARTSGAVLRDAADHSVVTIEVVDAGDDDQLVALATVTLQRRLG